MDRLVVRKAEDILHALRDKVAFLPGSRDRENRPIIFVPAREGVSQINPDIRNLLLYLYEVTADDAKERGFVFIIDMRKGTTWSDIKPVLKCLQEFFPGIISLVFIIKPENFWEKHKTSVSSGKYKFDIQMCSAEGLGKHIDVSQILREFGGTLNYDHEDWLELRVYIEGLVSKASDMLSHFTSCAEAMTSAEIPKDLAAAQLAMTRLEELHESMSALSVEMVECDIRQLEERICGRDSSLNGFTSGDAVSRGMHSNPDLTSIIPHLKQLVKTLSRTRFDALRQWEAKKQELDQCFQLKSFEDDVEKRSAWIGANYSDIANTFANTGSTEKETQAFINGFLGFANLIHADEVAYNQTINNGRRLLKMYSANGNSSSAVSRSIDSLLHQLERQWRSLLQLAEQRERLLTMALHVHQKCNFFLENCKIWMNNVGVDPDLVINKSHDEMKLALENHENFEKQFGTVYSEAYESATQLLKFMRKIFGDKNAGQNLSYTQLAEMIQRIALAKRHLHGIWKSRRETINYRMSSAAFFSDMRLVVDWLEKYGEPFLRRKILIGQDRMSTNSLSRNHEEFRKVAMITYQNAIQLFGMAQALKNSGEVDSEEINRAGTDLRRRMDNFRKKIDMRTNLLFLASNFFLHFDEIIAWYDRMDKRSTMLTVVPESVEECEQNKENFSSENDGTMQAFARVKHESIQLHDALVQQRAVLNVDNSDSLRHVERLVSIIESRHLAEKDRWPEQRIYLNAAVKIASFLRECDELGKQLVSWREDLKGLKHTVTNKAANVMQYHRRNTESVRSVILEAMNQMGEIVQFIQNKNLQLIIESTQQSAQDTVTSAATELQVLEKKVMEIASEVTDRIQLSLQVDKVNSLVNEVTIEIQHRQNHLHNMRSIPGNLVEAEQAFKDHNHFRKDCENVEKLLTNLHERCNVNYMLVNNVQIANMLEQVKMKWSHLVGLTENRTKLLNYCVNYYKCVKQVIPVSVQLEKELEGEHIDFCRKLLNHPPIRIDILNKVLDATLVNLNKNTTQKDKFLGAITYAQKMSDNLLKNIHRCGSASSENIALRESEVTAFKEQICHSKTRFLELWLHRKACIDECHITILLQISAAQIFEEIDAKCRQYGSFLSALLDLKNGGACSSTMASSSLNSSTASNEHLNEFDQYSSDLKSFVKDIRGKVKTHIQHTNNTKNARVDEFHRNLTDQAEQSVRQAFGHLYELSNQFDVALKKVSGIHESSTTITSSSTGNERSNANSDVPSIDISCREDLSVLDRYSDSTIEDKIQKDAAGGKTTAAMAAANELNNLNRKMLEPMNELIKSEKHYIEHLQTCINVYLKTYRMAGSMCPQSLRNKEAEIFGNIEQLYSFHSETFLKELLDHEKRPEDVGYCFIQWMEKLKELYADYCLNKEENNTLIAIPEAIKFFSEVREQNNLDHCYSLESMVIKPVQRITRYQLMLKQLMKSCSSTKKEIQDAFDAVVNIPKLANDRMHLKNFDSYEEHRVGDFIMQDAFLVSEPKRYFKREREMHVFLFESNIVFTKREEIAPKKIRYIYKDSMLLREIHIVEHVEGDKTKFGLRKESQIHQNDSTTVLKTSTESNRMFWVKTLRNLKLDMKLEQPKKSETSSLTSNVANRGSHVSRDSNTSNAASGAPEDRFSVASMSSVASGNAIVGGTVTSPQNLEQFLVGEDFDASQEGQLSVKTGQRVEILESFTQTNGNERVRNPEFVAVVIVDESLGSPSQRRGNVPFRILSPIVDADEDVLLREGTGIRPESSDAQNTSSHVPKRSSLRRFFNSSQNSTQNVNNSGSCETPGTSSHDAGGIGAASGSQHRLSVSSSSTPAAGTSAGQTRKSSQGNNDTYVLSSTVAEGGCELESSAQPQQNFTSTPAVATATAAASSGVLSPTLCGSAADLDLPPPMSQLSSEPIVPSGPVEGSAPVAFEDSPACAVPTFLAMNDESHRGDSPPDAAIATTFDLTTTHASGSGAESTAGTPQGGAIPAPIAQMSSEEASKMKRSYVLNELVETERIYVHDLTSVVEGYIANLSSMELPEDLQGKDKIIFANIGQILEFHKTTFVKDIEKCLVDYEAVGHAFIKHERRLNTYYVKYCQNKPKSDFLVSQESFEQFFAETKQKLGHKVALCDLLIKPIQRITKYQLMLADILKYTQRAGEKTEVLERALQVMRVVPKACDDMMQVGRLQNFEGNLNAQGRLLFQGTLQISDGPPSQPFRGKDRRVFLFEQSAIIADCIPPRKEYGNPTYIFKNQIMVNKMVLEDKVAEEPTRFVLTSNDPSQPAVFVAQAASMEDKQQWLAKISSQLDQQKTFLAALVDPKKYQNQLANSVGALSLSGKKDSSGSLGTPPGSAASHLSNSTTGASSPKHNNSSTKSSSSKLFGFGKSKS